MISPSILRQAREENNRAERQRQASEAAQRRIDEAKAAQEKLQKDYETIEELIQDNSWLNQEICSVNIKNQKWVQIKLRRLFGDDKEYGPLKKLIEILTDSHYKVSFARVQEEVGHYREYGCDGDYEWISDGHIHVDALEISWD